MSSSHEGVSSGPLSLPRFRNLWIASLLSNLGLMILSVGASWAMTEKTADASLVALVQTAAMLPMLILTLPAGAVADVYDRRIVLIVALLVSIAGSAALFATGSFQSLTAPTILILIFVTGCGMAFFWPTWQSGLADEVPSRMLPHAVGLNSVSYNSARVIGPAIGGAVVAVGGTVMAFGLSALLYCPMLLAQLRSKGSPPSGYRPPEGLGRAIISGIRYIAYTPDLRFVILRAFVFTLLGGSMLALMPLVASDLLTSGAEAFGILLGAFGVGAVLGAIIAPRLRSIASPEMSVRAGTVLLGVSMVGVALTNALLPAALILILAGIAWLLISQSCSVALQMLAPRWVAGRAVACLQASLSGGMAFAGIGWGILAEQAGVSVALGVAGIAVCGSAALGALWPVADFAGIDRTHGERVPDPEVVIPVRHGDGPVVVEVEYRVIEEELERFLDLMEEVQLSRQRNGAHAMTLARDVSDEDRWVERYKFPTWLEYLRHRDRLTATERQLHRTAFRYHTDHQAVRVRRLIEWHRP